MKPPTKAKPSAPLSTPPPIPTEPSPQRRDKTTLPPAMRQYIEQKAKVGDAILLFRMGDFYETFYDDARTIARVLGLTLTARDRNSPTPIPLAGVPYHAADRYIARLVKAGFKVAVSEQLEDPKTAKGVVKRDVVRIITPGTLTDENLLDERTEQPLAAIFPTGADWNSREAGLACVCLSSGQFFAQMLPTAALVDELARLQPAELIVPETMIDESETLVETLREVVCPNISTRPQHVFDRHLAKQSLCEHFKIKDLAGFGFDRFDASLAAAAAVLDYLKETQKSALEHILTIAPRASGDGVAIDPFTLRSLEVERTLRDGARDGALLGAIDMTSGPMGARLLRQWLCYPLSDVTQITARQDAIAALLDEPSRLQTLRGLLGDMGDIERILARIGVGRASPRDLAGLGRTLRLCADVATAIGPPVHDAGKDATDLLSQIAVAASGHDELAQYLAGAIKEDAPPVLRDGGFIADGFNAELDRLRQIGHEGHRYLAEFQAREIERTGIPTLKVGYNSVFGYYIEITHQHREKVPADYVRRQTVRNAERYITDELKRHEQDVLGAADRATALELSLFEEIRGRVIRDLPRLQSAARALATLDVLTGLAELSRRRDYSRPVFENPSSLKSQASGLLEIIDGRHPVLDAALADRFVPNDCKLTDDGDRLLIITGPNMAGKSTYIRQVALLTLLAHTGSYVPAKSMRLAAVDRIFARVGANDEIARGQSTFMVEMVETARILNGATDRSLVILDEIGRGTSTYDGLAIAWAVTEHLARRIRCRTLFATHYHELTDLAGKLPGVANFNVAVREQLRPAGAGRDVVFLHKIIPGPTDRSYGVHVAAMAGLPKSVVVRSEQVLMGLESGSSRRTIQAVSSEADQMLLFSPAASLPAWWNEFRERLRGVNIDKTTPLEALKLLEELQSISERDA
ncbi:MAG TPA: DNA mismatch repair protein MutS [Phycisphaerae bacterium]|nr:DNA mismatch repair protein MutS [Phycisphaerae bacterium]